MSKPPVTLANAPEFFAYFRDNLTSPCCFLQALNLDTEEPCIAVAVEGVCVEHFDAAAGEDVGDIVRELTRLNGNSVAEASRIFATIPQPEENEMEATTFIQELSDEINAVIDDGLRDENPTDPREVIAAVMINLAAVIPVAADARGTSIGEERDFAVRFLNFLFTQLPQDAIGAAVEDPAIR